MKNLNKIHKRERKKERCYRNTKHLQSTADVLENHTELGRQKNCGNKRARDW